MNSIVFEAPLVIMTLYATRAMVSHRRSSRIYLHRVSGHSMHMKSSGSASGRQFTPLFSQAVFRKAFYIFAARSASVCCLLSLSFSAFDLTKPEELASREVYIYIILIYVIAIYKY